MVTRRSEGLFLYAKLTMDEGEASLQRYDHVDLLEDTYTSILARQREEKGSARKFRWSSSKQLPTRPAP